MNARIAAALALLGACGPLWETDTPTDAGVDARPAGWSQPAQVNFGTGTQPIGSLVVAVDRFDVATVVWTQGPPAENHLWSRQRDPVEGWDDGNVRIEPDNFEGAALPQVAPNAAGDVHAVWQQTSGSYQSVRASVLRPDEGWIAATILAEELGMHAIAPRLAVQPDGAAVAVWQRTDNRNRFFEVWAARHDGELGWQAAERLDTSSQAQGADVAIDHEGNATAVWSEPDGIWSRRALVGAAWGPAIRVRNAADTMLPIAGADADADGVVFVVWMEAQSIRAARFDIAWQPPEVIATDGADPDLAVAERGDASVAWHDDAGRVHVRRFTPDTNAWGEAVTLPDAENAVQVRVDDQGFPVVGWGTWDTMRGHVGVSAFEAGAWTPASLLDDGGPTSSAGSIDVASSLDGVMLAVWATLDTGRGTVWASTYR